MTHPCKAIALIAFSCILMTSSVLAQSKINKIKVNNKRSWLDKIRPDSVSHFSIFSGPSLDLRGNPNNPDGTEDTGGQSSWHQISLRYQITKQTRFMFNPRFVIDYKPIESEDEKTFDLDNPVFGFTTTWYQNGRFSISGGLNSVAYVYTEDDRDDGLVANPGGFQSFNYQVSPALNIGSWFWFRYVYMQNADNEVPMFVSPYVSYNLSDRLNITAFYQYNGEFEDFDQVAIDTDDGFNLMASYAVTKNLRIQPVISLFRATDMEFTSGNLNMWVSGTF